MIVKHIKTSIVNFFRLLVWSIIFPIRKYINNPNTSFIVVIKGPVAKAGSIRYFSNVRGIKVPNNAAKTITVNKDKLTVILNSLLYPNSFVDINEEINSFDDHRIAMSFLIAGIRSKNGIRVKNCKNIETSFPHFKDIMNSLGMKINE